MRMYKVKLYKGNVAGDIAEKVLQKLPNVELVDGYNYDILFSASYPKRITQEECEDAKLGAVNIHTGLLPRHRGVAPLNWALIWGDKKAGVTVHKIVASFDAGDICNQVEVPIDIKDDIRSLKQKCFDAYEPIIKEFFSDPVYYLECAEQQNQAEVTYAPKRRPEDSELNLDASPTEIYNLWRSCDPDEYPAFIYKHGKKRMVTFVSEFGEVFIERREVEFEKPKAGIYANDLNLSQI